MNKKMCLDDLVLEIRKLHLADLIALEEMVEKVIEEKIW